MDPALIHNSYPLSFPLTSDFKYQATDRHYSTSLSNNEFLERRNGLTNVSMTQPMTLGRHSNGTEYNAGQMQHEAPCNTASSMILTPPQSGDESSSSATNPSSTSFAYSTLPKVSGSNVSGSEYYPSTASAYLQPALNGGANMTQFDRRGALQIPAPLSPPYSYGPMNSSSFPPFSMAQSRGFQFPPLRDTTYEIFNPARRPFQPSSMPLSGSLPYSSVHHQPPPRPEGPPFEDTSKVISLVGSRGQTIGLDIIASIPKGFFRVDDKWTCYRRNYFNVSCGFTLKTHTLDGQLFLQRYQHPEQVHSYAVSISAKTAAANNSESESRGLVQHTPKRDKATESVPTRHIVVPTPAQSLSNGHPLQPNGLYTNNSHLATCLSNPLDAFGHSAAQSPQSSYTFERIQFQKATANNGKRRAQQQYFHVVVKLEVNVARPGRPDDWVVIATRQSHPMVVRGRSPGHYKDNRRDSQTSMDPDNGCGHNGDNGSASFPMHGLGPGHGTGINSAPSHYRQSHHYGNAYSHRAHRVDDAESSSTSPESSSTLEASPTKGDNYHLACNMTRTSLPETSFDRIVLSPILSKIGSDTVGYHQSRKRPYDDDTTDCTSSFFNTSLEGNYHTPSFDFSAISASQALCASS